MSLEAQSRGIMASSLTYLWFLSDMYVFGSSGREFSSEAIFNVKKIFFLTLTLCKYVYTNEMTM